MSVDWVGLGLVGKRDTEHILEPVENKFSSL